MKTNLDSFFKTVDEPVDFEYGPVKFRCRLLRPTTPNFKAAMARHMKPHAHAISSDSLDPIKDLELRIKLFVEISLTGWTGLVIDDKEVEYTPKAAISLFKDLPEIFNALWVSCQDHKYYLEDLGNSSADT